MEYQEFEASAHMPLPSDEIFQIAADPKRLAQWIPSELAPQGEKRQAAKAGSAGQDSRSGMRLSPADHRLEWSTMTDGFDTWLEVRPAGNESDVTIHLSIPEGQGGMNQKLESQLQQALRRLEAEANKGLTV